jgi:glutathione S-transferase
VGYSVHLGAKFVSLDELPRVTDYYARLRERPAFQRSRGSRKKRTGS